MFNASSPFTLIASRAQRLLTDLESRIARGQVGTRAELLAQIIDALSQFNSSLTAPQLAAPRMRRDELLFKESVVLPFQITREDLELAYEQIELTRNLARQLFNVCQAERDGLNALLARATALVDEYRLWITDSDPSFQWTGDTFNDSAKLDPASTVFVDRRGGTVTLMPVQSQSLTDRVTAVTLDKSISQGGLPGNNLEIADPGAPAFTGDEPEPRPNLFSERKPRTDFLPAILDGQPDTWFEWERNYIDLPQAVQTVGTALVSDPAGAPRGDLVQLPNWTVYLRWPGEADVDNGKSYLERLKTQGEDYTTVPAKKVKGSLINTLTGAKSAARSAAKKATARRVQIGGYPLAEFSTIQKRTPLWLAVNLALDEPRPVSWLQLTPLIKGNTYPEVTQIWVSADGQVWEKLLTEPTVLNPRVNRGVDFTQLTGAASNFEGVGVWPLPGVPIRYVQILLTQFNSYPTTLGAAHRYYVQVAKKKKKRIQGPVPVIGSFAAATSDAPDTDFTEGADTAAATREYFDVFRADRQVIAIRDLLLEERLYAPEGQLLSQPLPLAQPGRAVALVTTEKIPADWPALAPDGAPWIRYELSSDGQDWKPIVPQIAQLDHAVVAFDDPVQSLVLRATFRRPDDRQNESPVLLAYALKVLT
jgi:hypothetical protein